MNPKKATLIILGIAVIMTVGFIALYYQKQKSDIKNQKALEEIEQSENKSDSIQKKHILSPKQEIKKKKEILNTLFNTKETNKTNSIVPKKSTSATSSYSMEQIIKKEMEEQKRKQEILDKLKK